MKKFFAIIGAAVLFVFSISMVKKVTGGLKKAHYKKVIKTA